MEHQENPRFNMHGYLIELDKHTLGWTWRKWEYAPGEEGKKRVICRRGSVQFMKMFPGLFPGTKGEAKPGVNPVNPVNSHGREAELKKTGVEFIFLYQGESTEESGFKTVKEAEQFHRLGTCPEWTFTDYWFAYDGSLGSWAMYDTFSGELQFTPAGALARLKSKETAGASSTAGRSRTGRFPGRTQYSAPVTESTYH
jgi:hypothetical protein